MVATEAQRLQEAHRAFARGRTKLASTGVVAALGLMLLGWWLSGANKSLAFGVALVILAGASLYVGRSAGRAVLPAFVIGLIPFSALLIVQAVTGHACHVEGCGDMCLRTCIASGLAAGGLLAFVALRSRATFAFVAAGATMTWLVGALGCPCVGLSSVLGMAAGIALPALFVLPRLRSRQDRG